MNVIPVIDLLNGIAVHGIRGERKHYQPLKSVLSNSANRSLDIASTFKSLGFSSLYLADLDAILKKSANFKIYKQIVAQTGLDLMVDAGISDLKTAQKVLSANVPKIVVGTETLTSLDFLDQAIKAFGEDKIVISIDLKQEKVLSTLETITQMDIVPFAQKLEKSGIKQIILLDLDRVGTEKGINLELLRKILDSTEVELLVGGGIRSLKELEELRNLGVSGALVATILHNGKLEVDELKSRGFL